MLELVSVVECELCSLYWKIFLVDVFGNYLVKWSNDFVGMDWLCLIINVFICLCFCKLDGMMEFEMMDVDGVLDGYMLWFDVLGCCM